MSSLNPNSLQSRDLAPWIGLATLPVLLGLVAIRQTERGLNQLGQLAETLFQGEQLPILK